MAFGSHYKLKYVKRGPYTKRDILLLDDFECSTIQCQDMEPGIKALTQAVASTENFNHMLGHYNRNWVLDSTDRGQIRIRLLRLLVPALPFNTKACSLHCMLDDAWIDEPWTFHQMYQGHTADILNLVLELRQQLSYTIRVRDGFIQRVVNARIALNHIWVRHLASDDEEFSSGSSDS